MTVNRRSAMINRARLDTDCGRDVVRLLWIEMVRAGVAGFIAEELPCRRFLGRQLHYVSAD